MYHVKRTFAQLFPFYGIFQLEDASGADADAASKIWELEAAAEAARGEAEGVRGEKAGLEEKLGQLEASYQELKSSVEAEANKVFGLEPFWKIGKWLIGLLPGRPRAVPGREGQAG